MYKSVNRILSTKKKKQIQAPKKTCEKYQEKKKKIEYVVVKDVVILL